MKAMILAAGRGERLRPLTDNTPKPLIRAGNKRLIEYLIERLVAANITDIVINYAHLGEQFPQTLGDGSRYGARFNYSPEPAGGLETAGGIIHALTLLDCEQFLVINGDIWTDYDFSTLSRQTLSDNFLCHLVMVDNPPQHPNGDFALTDNLIATEGNNKLTFSGIGLYRRTMFDGYESGRRALKPLFLDAISQRAVTGEYYPGDWSDIGTVERLTQLENQLKAS